MTEPPRTPTPSNPGDPLEHLLRDAAPHAFAPGFADRVLARPELQDDAAAAGMEAWLRVPDLWFGLRWLSLPLTAASLLLLVHNYQIDAMPDPDIPVSDRLLGLGALQPDLLIIQDDLP